MPGNTLRASADPDAAPAPSSSAAPDSLRAYASRALPVDELSDGRGELRPAWRDFAARFDALGAAEIARRWEQARHLIHDNGVSFNVYGDALGMERPWPLGPMPIMVGADEFAALSKGLTQRARLFDAILTDLYGPQRLLEENLLPAELVLAHPGFLRPCRGVEPPGGRFLHFYASDLVRDESNGAGWHVLADRTQAPSGAGYALENRIIVSRLLPDEFRECHIERLAPYFQQVRRSMAALAPHAKENPRVVLLSPGPYNATYFEQAFLAQYLGYMLVEGADLTVRDGCVYLKTLGGLHRVDVIVRRLNDDFCDPLELRADSALGVPGLLQAVRDGNVAIANALGSGVVQTAALMPFLPGVCRALLGEELALPAIETWWCGEPRVLAHVLAHLPDMVIKPAYPVGRTEPVFCDELDAAGREALRARLQANPAAFVAQRRATLSTTPLWEAGTLHPRRLLLRTFMVADSSDPAAYRVMPGGLGVVAARDQRHDISIQRGAASQDTWVVSDGPVSTLSLLRPAGARVELSRGGGDLPSRVADNLYWLGRYAERADAMARLARTAVAHLPDGAEPADSLIAALRAQARLKPAPGEAQARDRLDDVAALVFDGDTQGTLADTLRSVHRTARAIRDRLSSDTWRVIMSLDQEMREAESWRDSVNTTGALSALLDRLVALLAALSGLVMDSMSRGHGWRFLDMGRRLERAVSLTLTIDATITVARPAEPMVLESVLEAADSAITYRRRYLASLHAAAVLDLLLCDPTNPRSVVFQLGALLEHVVKLPHLAGRARDGIESAIAQGADALLSRLEEVSVHQLAEVGADERRADLAGLTAELGRELPAFSDALTESYLNHALQARQLGRLVDPPSAAQAPPMRPAEVDREDQP